MPNPSLERTSNGWPLFRTPRCKPPSHRPARRSWGKSREKKSDGGIALILSPVFAGHLRIPISEGSARIDFPRPNVQLVNRRQAETVRLAAPARQPAGHV